MKIAEVICRLLARLFFECTTDDVCGSRGAKDMKTLFESVVVAEKQGVIFIVGKRGKTCIEPFAQDIQMMYFGVLHIHDIVRL